MELKNLIKSHFTSSLRDGQSVFDLFEWKKVDVVLKSYSTGETLTEMLELEFPVHYSQSACDIIASKYFRKKGVPNERGYEFSMKEVAHRMVGFWVEALVDEKLIEEHQKTILYNELVYMLLAQMYAPNSPQWFNTGLKYAYNIGGEKQGHFYFNEETQSVEVADDAYSRTQGSACFIISIADTLLGDKSLTDQISSETLLFKYGSGVGTNWSNIRGKNEYLSGGGKSSGLLSFLKVSDQNAGAIKSGGTTRRAAKMVVLDIDHPEIESFINWKSNEEDKVLALAKMGYSTSFEGEAYATVSGQNSNNSVRVSDEFMNKIGSNNDLWNVVGRVSDNVNKELSATELWNDIAAAAWKCGDPGLQYDSTINAWHTCPGGEDGNFGAKYNRINASNPCSEYMFLDDTACNLASINVMEFLDIENNTFDVEGYKHAISLIQLVLEATIHFGQFPTADIARKSHLFRTTGLGLTNLGMMFMSLAIPYNSEEARNLGAVLTSIMTSQSYVTSALMAEKVGAFAKFEINRDSMLRVIRNHNRVAGNSELGAFEDIDYAPFIISNNILSNIGFDNLYTTNIDAWNKALTYGEKFGYRNAQVSVLAPTGTIAFAMDCATTSSEPFFSHVVFKKLVGGGYMEIINPAMPAALNKLGYTDIQIEEIINYVMAKNENGMIADGKIEGAPHLLAEHYSVFDTANKCGSGSRYISPEAHVKMMAALTPNVTGAISKTVNMPNEATVEDIEKIYMMSWKLGVKAIAIYRDGCKASQPLNSTTKTKKEVQLEDLSYAELLKFAKEDTVNRPPVRHKPTGIRSARVHEASLNGLKLYITTSYDEETKTLSEIYVSCGRQGSLTKGLLDSLSTTISKMLQYGVPAMDIARMYRGQKYEPSGFVSGHPYIKSVDSISDLISKIIDIELGDFTYCQVKPDNYQEVSFEPIVANTVYKKPLLKTEYDSSDYLYSETCPTCSSTKMVQNGTCKICTECGTTTGCS